MAGDPEMSDIPGGPWTTESVTSNDGGRLVLKYGQLLSNPGMSTFVFEEYVPDGEMRQSHSLGNRPCGVGQRDVARWLADFMEAGYAQALAQAFALAYPAILLPD